MAGTPCHVGDATCTGGTCTTFGGQGCAANCTFEHDVTFLMVPGQPDGIGLQPGTSGVVIQGYGLSIPWPFAAACSATECRVSREIWTVGKLRNGKIPVVVKTGGRER